MSFLDGASLEPLFDLDAEPRPTRPSWPIAFATRRRAMARLHRLEPASVGLGGEPVVGPAEEIERWCRLLETVDPDLVPGWRGRRRRVALVGAAGIAARRRARRLPPRQPACHR